MANRRLSKKGFTLLASAVCTVALVGAAGLAVDIGRMYITKNEAQSYANKVVPEARGRAAQITQSAEAYRDQTVAEAKGATSRFLQVYDEYKKAPDVTRQRMYLETMERLFGGTDKIIMDQGGGVVPYLPLDQLTRRPQTPPQTGGSR